MNGCRTEQPLLTIFTPTYNRSHTLLRTYASLQAQSCKDFIWLVVDDGSTDNTSDLVKKWQQEDCGFEIRYLYKSNGGMHSAHNAAYAHVDTVLCMAIDSDDTLAENAVDVIAAKWEAIKNDERYAGMIGLDADMSTGSVIGTAFPEGMTETTLSGFYAAGGKGDKKLVFRTDRINSVPPYPEFEGERYVALSYKPFLLDQNYTFAVIDHVLTNVEYQPDGSSRNMWRQYLNNPKGFAFWRKVKMQYPDNRKRLVVDCIHYCSSSFLANDHRFVSNSPHVLLTIICVPAGLILALITRVIGKKP